MLTQEEIRQKIQKEATEAHLNNPILRSTIASSVGSGKSKIAIDRIKQLYKANRKTKVLFTGARDVYLVNFELECKKFKCSKGLMNNITFSTVASLNKLTEQSYDIIIYDEAHKDTKRYIEFATSQLQVNPKVEMMCLTGTPLDSRNTYLYNICPIVYKHLVEDSVNVGLVNDYRVVVVYHELDQEKNIHVKTSKYDFYTSEKASYDRLYKNYLFREYTTSFPKELQFLKSFLKNSPTKQTLLSGLARMYDEMNDGKILVYAGSIDQATKLGYPMFNSKMKKEEKIKNFKDFVKGNINVLVDVAGIKESVSVPNLKTGIISHIDSNPGNFEQQLGRLLRLVPNEEIGTMYVLVAKGTIEEQWCINAFSKLDPLKIIHMEI